MCHENKMGAAKNSTHIEQYKLSKDSGTAVEQGTAGNSDPSPIHEHHPQFIMHVSESLLAFESSCVQSIPEE